MGEIVNDNQVNNNSDNNDLTRNQSDRPLPPLPRTADGSLNRLDESPDDSDIEEDDESDVECNNDDDDDESVTNEDTSKLLNGTSSNGNPECELSFDADATLPPSPSKSSNPSLTEQTTANSSYELSPTNERFLHCHLIFDYYFWS